MFATLSRLITHPPGKRLPLFLLLASFATLCGAWISQYGFNKHPCELCMAQRYPYMFAMAISVLALLIRHKHVVRLCLLLCAFAFLCTGSIALYHAGVEQGVIEGPAACSGSNDSAQTLDELRASIMNAPLVSCSQASVEVMGISMAGWNAVAGFFLLGITLAGLRALRQEMKHG